MEKGSVIFLFSISFCTFFLLSPTPLLAQPSELSLDEDFIAPMIQHTPSGDSISAKTSLKLKAVVTDDAALKEVILFYRTKGLKKYHRVQMLSIDKGTYVVEIPKEEVLTPGMEYYIQAVDSAENTSMRGFSSSPLTLVVSPLPPLENREENSEPRVEKTEETTDSVVSAKKTDDKGAYVGVGVGNASIKETVNLLGGIGVKIFSGYKIHRNLSLEVGYTLFDGVEGFEFDAVGNYPVNDRFSLFVKFGFFKWDVTGDLEVNGIKVESSSGTTPFFGLGGTYWFGNSGVTLVFERYEIEDFTFGVTGGKEDIDIAFLSASWVYRFR